MRIVGRLERLGSIKFFSLGRVIVRTAHRYSVEANPKFIRRRDFRAWSGGLETCGASKCEENTNDRVTGRAGERRMSRAQESRGKAVVHVPGAC